ncbi:DUF4367 domain-containing protein [Faecalicatena sp. Marseille-Q4148]|nr:DUF4367 domain-containing protein [Faecalicatena sp. Marseille-Q4148]
MDEKKELCNKSSENRIKNPSEHSEQTGMSNHSVLNPTPEMKERLEKRIEEYEKQRELQEQLYAQLSEEDREALKLGKELQRQRKIEASSKESQRKKNRCTKSGSWKKNIVSAAAGIGIVIAVTSGFTIASVGGPKQALKIAREMFGERNRITINGVTEEEKKESGMDSMDAEEQAYQQIKDELGFDPVRLGYLPEGMVFEESVLDETSQDAYLYYRTGDKTVSYFIKKHYTEGKLSADIEDEMISQFYIPTNEINIKISEYVIKGGIEKKYMAEFVYNDTWYCVAGQIEKKEMEKIIKNLIFL